MAIVLGKEGISLRQLKSGPEADDGGRFPQVMESLARAILVVSEGMSAGEAIQCHRAAWDWVEELSSGRDQHELAFLFILPEDSSQEFEDALAVGLGVPRIDPASTGHAVWRRTGSLSELLDVLTGIRPMDLLPLRARRGWELDKKVMTIDVPVDPILATAEWKVVYTCPDGAMERSALEKERSK